MGEDQAGFSEWQPPGRLAAVIDFSPVFWLF
jgi:hypothetical protein